MDVAAEGKAIAKVNDLVIFVPYVVPGDVVDLQIKRKKNKYAEAEAVKFHELSPVRAVPFFISVISFLFVLCLPQVHIAFDFLVPVG